MFIGHFAVGLGVKAVKPGLSLGTYFLAVQFVDLIWPTLLLLGLEKVAIEPGNTAVTPLNFISYPYTHSLVMAVVWAAVIGFIVWLIKKDISVSLLAGLCVASHWFLDFLTHRPDLPLTLSETTKVGLGLWNYKAATIIIETILFLAATWLYIRKTKPKDKIGSYGFWSLIIFLILIHISNMAGPPPPNITTIAWAGHLQWLFVLWAYWADGHRELR
jgi:membrane-bound metal-dependent hydrolase YbcI (DUF457 family)